MKKKVLGWILWSIIQICIVWVTLFAMGVFADVYPYVGFSWSIGRKALLILVPLFVASWFSWKLAHPKSKEDITKKEKEEEEGAL